MIKFNMEDLNKDPEEVVNEMLDRQEETNEQISFKSLPAEHKRIMVQALVADMLFKLLTVTKYEPDGSDVTGEYKELVSMVEKQIMKDIYESNW